MNVDGIIRVLQILKHIYVKWSHKFEIFDNIYNDIKLGG
jgi:hypothetical protein